MIIFSRNIRTRTECSTNVLVKYWNKMFVKLYSSQYRYIICTNLIDSLGIVENSVKLNVL